MTGGPATGPPASRPGRRGGDGPDRGIDRLGLRARGWHVTGYDSDPARAEQAKKAGVIDAVGLDPEAQITFIATPLNAVTGRGGRPSSARPGYGPTPWSPTWPASRGRWWRPSASPVSSAATPWPAPSRWAWTGPTPSSSWAPPGS